MNRAGRIKVFVLFAICFFAFVLLKTASVSTIAKSFQNKRELDNRVPEHLPITVRINKEKEQSFNDPKNDHWARDFVLEVKNISDRPIYALSLVWVLTEVTMPDGNHYGSTFKYGREEFITVPGEKPRPDDIPIQPGETHVFQFSNSGIAGWEDWAKDNHLQQPKSLQIIFNFIGFGDGTGWEGPNGQRFDRQKALSFFSGNKDDPSSCEQQAVY